ncbi:MAG: hypothetical protein A2677_00940 [Candidatus Komeilibacteria bacterium RIFCSPHIGHO2_01_FULL_52_14]|uniref:DDH domain-containing protein n=1 Tax=Candidatus Komeilibacteria bacterium RIFCSPHIGHO2_01_FULL_52_14 TaxID=1798549 RepID=A0A1G2BKB4_9BACT|nr:MAG: hypothetical protein A2677_00940 [Candidatus Komeilibacteria bacterium RIFCSPHIGHO2_01_FULL_52_14]
MPHTSLDVKTRLFKLKQFVTERWSAPASPVPCILVAQVDPDAVGSAAGLRYLFKQAFDCAANICYFGSISHPQNRAIFNKLDLYRTMRAVSMPEVGSLPLMLVDSSSLDDARIGRSDQKTDPVVVIDHHRGATLKDDEKHFIWIDDVGAASTLVTELIQGADLAFNEEDSDVALLLALGIYTDTYRLTTATERDFKAFEWLRCFFKRDDFNELLNYPLSPAYFRNVQTALNRQVLSGSRLVATVGRIDPDEGDDLAIIADELIRRTGISLVVVWGLIDGNKVRFSARNMDISMSLVGFLHERFGSGSSGAKLLEGGRGVGGGLITVDLGPLQELPLERRLNIMGELMQDKVFRE